MELIKSGEKNCEHLYSELGCIESVNTFLTCLKCNREIYLQQGQEYYDFIMKNRNNIHPDELEIFDKAIYNIKHGIDFC